MRRASRPAAALTALALLAQSTGAANIPVGLLVPGAVAPAALRPGAFPPAVAVPAASVPADPTWLGCARVVLEYLTAAPYVERPAARPPVAAAPAAPVAPPADRMLITLPPGEHIAAILPRAVYGLAAAPSVANAPQVLAPFYGDWISQNGISVRVEYLSPRGLVVGSPDGWTLERADGAKVFAAERRLARAYQREFPVYWPGDVVEVRVIVRNDGDETLTGLDLSAVEEAFHPSGTEGVRLAPPVARDVRDVDPGASVMVAWSMSLTAHGSRTVNLEQTHLRVTRSSPDGEKILLDAPQAGAVDPPGPALRGEPSVIR